MPTQQAITLVYALKNIGKIKSKMANTGGALTFQLFGTSTDIPDQSLDNARGAIAFEFQSLVQNRCAMKTNDPIALAYPDIHHNLKEHISRRNWLSHE